MTPNLQIELLRNDLKKFGLNPSEWCLCKLQPKVYKVAHIRDRSFYFLGRSKAMGLRMEWAQLDLMSV